MKKVSLLIAMIAFVCGNAFAQLSYDFNDCPAGAKIAQTLGEPWSTWSNAPGGAEDGVFAEAGGSMAAHFTYGNDQIVQLGEVSVGVYDLEFDAYVPEGKNGYFNVLHHFVVNGGTGTSWAMQVYMHMTSDGQNATQAPGQGTVHAGSNSTCDLPCVYDQWMHFRVHVDADNDVAQLYFNVVGQAEELYAEWQWSLDSFGANVVDRSLGAMDFFPPQNAASSEYYLDNLTVTLQSNDEVLIGDSFEEYPVGGKIAQSAVAIGNDWWTTWNSNPGGSNDGTVSDAFASEGNNSGYFTSASDQVLLLGGQEMGVYELSFDVYTATGKDGYFNILHSFAGGDSDWAMQVYFNAETDEQNSSQWHSAGHGTVHAGGAQVADLPCVYDEWMNVVVHIDCDSDVATLFFNGEEYYTWQWSVTSFGDPSTRVIDAVNFYGPQSSSQFYVDNITFTRIGGESAPNIAFVPGTVEETLVEDEFKTVNITIENSGNSIGDWVGWLDFGQGAGGNETQFVNYDAEPGSTTKLVGWNTDEPFSLEVGAMFPASIYAGAVMGTKIIGAQYYFGESQDGGIGIEEGTDVTLRIYAQGQGELAVGEVLAEKTIPYSQVVPNEWNAVVFDEPVDLTGYNFFVAAEYTQAVEGYAANFDGGVPVPYGDLYRQRSSGNFRQISDGGNVYGNTHIRVTCQGSPVLATWATLDKNYGSIMGGAEDVVTLTLNTIGLVNELYEANFVVKTNDANMASVEIPVILHFDIDAVEENNDSQLASIYPNPATSQVTLDGQDLNSVAIYNVAGQLVRVVKLDNFSTTIDMNVEAGVYFFSVYDNNGNNSVQRVVIVK